jgi:DNA-directed RNA polymerase subunit RPC12/RpoP
MTDDSAACARCGYDLAGLGAGAACPECGSKRRRASRKPITARQLAGVLAHAFGPALLSILVAVLMPAGWFTRISLGPGAFFLMILLLLPGAALAHAGWMFAVVSVLVPARPGADVVICIGLGLAVFVADVFALGMLLSRFVSYSAGGP